MIATIIEYEEMKFYYLKNTLHNKFPQKKYYQFFTFLFFHAQAILTNQYILEI